MARDAPRKLGDLAAPVVRLAAVSHPRPGSPLRLLGTPGRGLNALSSFDSIVYFAGGGPKSARAVAKPRYVSVAPYFILISFSPYLPGTRIIYDRKFLLDRRNSPMAQTPPCHLPNIPGVTSPGTLIEDSKVEVNNLNNLKHAVGDDSQFEMDI
ncbi:eukaryotic translation initiation factor 4E-binding protein 2 [Fukomys damarensis]|uniref:eukaryotic translation initiation factor 4E-binding protein 2 n=1 Tax=Fukomys damarensis TaxID=885580 RepID=UPI00053FAAC4|nr:eukaryotic translation initiation factor 4E-binding protein 2 [Fukomys damarensis]